MKRSIWNQHPLQPFMYDVISWFVSCVHSTTKLPLALAWQQARVSPFVAGTRSLDCLCSSSHLAQTKQRSPTQSWKCCATRPFFHQGSPRSSVCGFCGATVSTKLAKNFWNDCLFCLASSNRRARQNPVRLIFRGRGRREEEELQERLEESHLNDPSL